jgi:protein ImuB
VVTGEPWRYRVEAAPDVAVRRWTPVASWAGPWPVDDAWWQQADPDTSPGLSARFQVVGVDGRAWLLVWRRDGWEVEAAYD